MIRFTLNGQSCKYSGNPETLLLPYLRTSRRITSPKDGCSGEGSCGACTVEINGTARLACRTKMKDLNNAVIITTEGLPEQVRELLGSMFAKHGAVQCGFCTPGFIMRTRNLFQQKEPPKRADIVRAIQPNICRCTGYIKIVDALEAALRDNQVHEKNNAVSASIGSPLTKYEAYQTAIGARYFVDDLFFEGMLYGVLKFSDHPRARILEIDTAEAESADGVEAVFTAADIPGDRKIGLIFQDWPVMVGKDETTNCIGDVVAAVVARTEEAAREAAEKIRIRYKELDGVYDVHRAMEPSATQVHEGQSNVLETCAIHYGNVNSALREAAFVSSATYETQRVEHAFLEPECAVALPHHDGIRLYSQGQGVYVDRKQVAKILGIREEKVQVIQVANGGGFGGKEDLTVQGHAGLSAYLLKRPVKVRLSRQESLRMHPKRHPVWMDMQVSCDRDGKLTALRLRALGDTGAYASVGTKVMERVVGHATGGYVIPAVDIQARTIYTNNVPSGAMRGFGVPQVTFALESCIDDLCRQGGFDRWQMRYDNALFEGSRTATGQRLEGVGLKKTLLAVKDAFKGARYAGIACALKNSGVGNGMIDESGVKIEIVSSQKVIIHHGWTEMGQGIHTMAIQTLHEETGIDPSVIEVRVDTSEGVPTGMTTSSRGTALLGNAIINASSVIKSDTGGKKLSPDLLEKLSGQVFRGKYVCDWTCKPGTDTEDPKIHFAYGYATQVAILDEKGKLQHVVAAHDAGRVMNPTLFEGQIEGSVHMGMGYALSENLPMDKGKLLSSAFKDLGIVRAKHMPEVTVIAIEEHDPHGPFGAKGIGEIGMVPTAAAIANAYAAYDGKHRTRLPLE